MTCMTLNNGTLNSNVTASVSILGESSR